MRHFIASLFTILFSLILVACGHTSTPTASDTIAPTAPKVAPYTACVKVLRHGDTKATRVFIKQSRTWGQFMVQVSLIEEGGYNIATPTGTTRGDIIEMSNTHITPSQFTIVEAWWVDGDGVLLTYK
jgi:hypothetical protein